MTPSTLLKMATVAHPDLFLVASFQLKEGSPTNLQAGSHLLQGEFGPAGAWAVLDSLSGLSSLGLLRQSLTFATVREKERGRERERERKEARKEGRKARPS